MATRLVQTNEVARCGYMMPAFTLIASETPGSALSLVDVGASAGLNLLWDRYSYVYSGRIRAGIASSPVLIETEARGDREPPIPRNFPAVVFRVGIDLSPVDLTDAESALWLRVLVWPEHQAGQPSFRLQYLWPTTTHPLWWEGTHWTSFRESSTKCRKGRRFAYTTITR